MATISGSVLMMLGWFTNYFYLQSIAREHVFNIKQYYPQVNLVFGLMGGMLLMGNTATIDTGKMNEKWHTSCASSFFIFTLAAQLYNAIIYSLIYSKTKAVSYNNLLFKYVLIGLLVVQILLSTYQGGLGGFWNLTE